MNTHFSPPRSPDKYYHLPFRFARLGQNQVLVTSEAGDFHVLNDFDFSAFAGCGALSDDSVLKSLEAKHLAYRNMNAITNRSWNTSEVYG